MADVSAQQSWEELPLRHFVDANRSICYGIVQPGKQNASGVPIVRVNNFTGTGLELSDAMRVDQEIETNYRRSRLQGGELLVSLVGSLGQTAIAPPELRGWNVARAVGVVPLADEADARWINFVIRSQPAQNFMRSRANTTVQATFNLKDLAELPIPYPPSNLRQPMSELLAALDDKIELNRRMNATLEAQARALFRDWFVEFGPTRAKQADAPAYLAPHLWSLFPSTLNAEGKPEGWETSDIYRVANVIYGAPFASDRFNSDGAGRPLVRIRDLPNHRGGFCTDEIHKKEYLIQPGDIVVGMDGEFRAYLWQGEPSLMNQRVCCFAPKSKRDRGFLWLATEPHLASCEGSAIGTTVIHLGKKDIDRFDAISPGQPILEAFSQLVEPLIDRLVANGQESRTLAQTRDLLLPKLMSGDISVRTLEAALG